MANLNEVNWTLRCQTRDVVRSEVAMEATLQSEAGRSERLRSGCCKRETIRYPADTTEQSENFFLASVRNHCTESNSSVCYAFVVNALAGTGWCVGLRSKRVGQETVRRVTQRSWST